MEMPHSYELHLSFLVKSRHIVTNDPMFALALARAIGWLRENKPKAIIPCLATAYMDFFAIFEVADSHKSCDLIPLF